jgi:hypothetical protein
VAYRLALPPSSSIHPVFHVSQFKHMVSATSQVSSALPNAMCLYQVPKAILDSKMVRKGDTEVPQLLIKWSNMPPKLAT